MQAEGTAITGIGSSSTGGRLQLWRKRTAFDPRAVLVRTESGVHPSDPPFSGRKEHLYRAIASSLHFAQRPQRAGRQILSETYLRTSG